MEELEHLRKKSRKAEQQQVRISETPEFFPLTGGHQILILINTVVFPFLDSEAPELFLLDCKPDFETQKHQRFPIDFVFSRAPVKSFCSNRAIPRRFHHLRHRRRPRLRGEARAL